MGAAAAVAGDLKFNQIAASTVPTSPRQERLNASVERAIDHCNKIQRRLGLPGLSVAVAVDGQVVFRQGAQIHSPSLNDMDCLPITNFFVGFGYADIENDIFMKPENVMRIASISKSITMAMLAAQMEEGKVDIDLPIQTYLPNFPVKKWDGSPVTLTVRHFLTHTSGTRHYRKKEEIAKKKESETSDSDYAEFFSRDGCESVTKALEIFQNDELIHKPGKIYSL